MSESTSLLQCFFDASLIPSETDDVRLGHYQSAAADLCTRFQENPQDAVSACRVAIDPSCPGEDPWFDITQDAVKVYWKTFLVSHCDKPRQICRAILLEALSNAAEESRDITLGIWNSASSLLPHLGDGPELELIRDFISELGDHCEEHSSSEWKSDVGSSDSLPEFKIQLPAVKLVKVSEAELTKGMVTAVGPLDKAGAANENPNPNWPNVGQPWSHEFAPRAATAITTSVNKALASTSPAIKAISEKLKPSLLTYATELCEWTTSLARVNQRFTELLWWKQALYSPTFKRSYRNFSKAALVIGAPYDLSNISGAPIPLSVEFFLCETIHTLFPDDPQVTLEQLIDMAVKEDGIEEFLPPITDIKTRRLSLREFISLSLKSRPTAKLVQAYVGVDQATSLRLSEWTIWLLRDRLAEIITTSSPE